MKNVLTFLEDLKKNNDREWFNEHKDRYVAARDEFKAFVGRLLPLMAGIDKELAGLEPKQCIFRIYRDVRFSHDKSPYKTNMGAAMRKGGRKSPYATYYLHLEPGISFAGGGIWMPEGHILKAMRQEIYYNAGEFQEITGSPEFKKCFGGLQGDKLKRAPRDFPADFHAIELLKYKSYIAGSPLPDSVFSDDSLIHHLLDIYKALYPFNRFINRALADV